MESFNNSTNKNKYIISLYIDSPDAWIMPWAEQLKTILSPFHKIIICNRENEITKGDFNFLLGCTRLLKREILDLNTHNIIIHESNLPKGKGWSPLSWQILEGKNTIPITLFEANEQLDAGDIYLQDKIMLEGNELLPEIKQKQGEKTIEMVLCFLEQWPDIQSSPQKGNETVYRKRTINNDQLDINKSIAEQFNHLRIVDNEKYPAWFQIQGKKFKLKIYPYS